MKAWTRGAGVCLLGAVVALATAAPPPTRAQQSPPLTPRFGETKAEFEARQRGLPPPPPAPMQPSADTSSVTLAADPSGHFFVEPTVNGARMRMMVDTGATSIALTQDDARRIGIRPSGADFTARSRTANGVTPVAPVMLREVAIGGISVRDVPAVVHSGNALQFSLLGMSFLSKLSHFEVTRGRLTLKR
jgi:aspartyl protease family protein